LALYSKYARALTFENVYAIYRSYWDAQLLVHSGDDVGGVPLDTGGLSEGVGACVGCRERQWLPLLHAGAATGVCLCLCVCVCVCVCVGVCVYVCVCCVCVCV